jgi:hypothetical protein
MTDEELIELEGYYNNLLLMGETSFVYDYFEITKTGINEESPKGKWTLKRIVSTKTPLNIVIPDFIQVIGANSFCYHSKPIVSVEIPDGVEKIGKAAFRDCPITKVVLPSTLKKIDMLAFYTNKLRELYIPDSVEQIGAGAFCYNEFLKSLSLPSGIILYDNAFKYCGRYYSKSEINFEVRTNPNTPDFNPIVCHHHAFYQSPSGELAKEYLCTA